MPLKRILEQRAAMWGNADFEAVHSMNRNNLLHEAVDRRRHRPPRDQFEGYHQRKIEHIISFGTEVNLVNAGGNTAAHLCNRDDRTPALVDLVRNGADLEIQDRQGRTVLQRAAERGQERTLVTLLQLGARRDTLTPQGRAAASLVIERQLPASLHHKQLRVATRVLPLDEAGTQLLPVNALADACQGGNLMIIKFILRTQEHTHAEVRSAAWHYARAAMIIEGNTNIVLNWLVFEGSRWFGKWKEVERATCWTYYRATVLRLRLRQPGCIAGTARDGADVYTLLATQTNTAILRLVVMWLPRSNCADTERLVIAELVNN